MVELRELRSADEELLFEWRARPEVADYMFTDHAIGPDEHHRWFHETGSDPARQYWIIVSSGEDVGLADLYDIDDHNSRCSWGLYIAETAARGRGVGTAVSHLVMSEVFERRRLNRLSCEVLATNAPAVALYRRCGFVEEGTLREHVRKGDRRLSVVVFGMLRREWLALRQDRGGPADSSHDYMAPERDA